MEAWMLPAGLRNGVSGNIGRVMLRTRRLRELILRS